MINFDKLAHRCEELIKDRGSAYGLMDYLREWYAPGIRRSELVDRNLPLAKALKRFFDANGDLRDNPKALLVFKEYFTRYLEHIDHKETAMTKKPLAFSAEERIRRNVAAVTQETAGVKNWIKEKVISFYNKEFIAAARKAGVKMSAKVSGGTAGFKVNGKKYDDDVAVIKAVLAAIPDPNDAGEVVEAAIDSLARSMKFVADVVSGAVKDGVVTDAMREKLQVQLTKTKKYVTTLKDLNSRIQSGYYDEHDDRTEEDLASVETAGIKDIGKWVSRKFGGKMSDSTLRAMMSDKGYVISLFDPIPGAPKELASGGMAFKVKKAKAGYYGQLVSLKGSIIASRPLKKPAKPYAGYAQYVMTTVLKAAIRRYAHNVSRVMANLAVFDETAAARKKSPAKKPAKKAPKVAATHGSHPGMKTPKKPAAKKSAGKRAGKKPEAASGKLSPHQEHVKKIAAAPKGALRRYRLTSDEKKAVKAAAKHAGGWILQVNERRGKGGVTSINALAVGGNMEHSDTGDNRWTMTEMDKKGIPLVSGRAIVDIFTYSGTHQDPELESNIVLHIDTAKGGLVKITGDSENGATYWKKG